MILLDELGMTNYTFGGAEGNFTTSTDKDLDPKEVKMCANVPIGLTVTFAVITLEIIKLVMGIIIKSIKLHKVKLRPLPPPPPVRPQSDRRSLHHLQPERTNSECVLNPLDLEQDNVGHYSRIIHVLETENNAVVIEHTAALDEGSVEFIDQNAATSEANAAIVEHSFALTAETSPSIETSAANDETAVTVDEIAASNEENDISATSEEVTVTV